MANDTPADVDHFFKPAAKSDLVKGDKKKRSYCKSCIGGCVKKDTLLVAETTTQRRHMEYAHEAFEHPVFKRMIQLAARATRDVNIPSRKQTRSQILNTFKEQMKGLSERLNVGHITCDNASNNDTMLKEFARCYKIKTGKLYDVEERQIRCLAHFINLAAQELISTRSDAKYVTAQEADVLLDEISVAIRDEIALVRAEKNADNRRRLQELLITEEEWETVTKFCNLLQVADDAQHAFSAAARPTLHNALPAIEKMYSSGKRLRKCQKLVSTALDPRKKFAHFERNWGGDLTEDVESTVRSKFIERYNALNTSTSSTSPNTSRPRPSSIRASAHPRKRRIQLASLSDDESDSDPITRAPSNPLEPWRTEWDSYLNTHEVVPNDMGIVEWWGLNVYRYPTFASMARDYLAVMAASVSSERAFSSAGIRISKRRNRLKGDIVEAIECMECIYHHGLLFRRVVTRQAQIFSLILRMKRVGIYVGSLLADDEENEEGEEGEEGPIVISDSES
ncbi:hypothetical protein CVT24_012453 [Panaeolus cyanescens]|uniref:HAT C-terminal dimerisation domain-containing protein n=1 Tax=Panaeolus cyanescens TaxID=181874 RepID=A0A409WZC4_9AGAR|nr:hypothetical protein CVT24_012453 [Panaeolus cyanescens]